jgi:predicted nucleic acid-binding protein
MRQLMIADTNPVVSFVTLVELQSAVTRRTKADDLETRQRASQFLSVLQSGWTVADDYEQIITGARRLAAVHALRGADAIQLASALSLPYGGGQMEFVTLDEELAAAARAEGFPVLP